jgi:hypothetical protein
VPQVAALDAVVLRDRLAAGELNAVQLLESCLERVDAREAEVKAWRFLDRDFALKKAGEADEWRKRGLPVGPTGCSSVSSRLSVAVTVGMRVMSSAVFGLSSANAAAEVITSVRMVVVFCMV